MNTGLSACKVSTLKAIFGPFPDLPVNCSSAPKNKKVAALTETRNVMPPGAKAMRVTAIKPFLDALERVFKKVYKDHPALCDLIKSQGGLCYRAVRGSSSPSNHAAGTAIDLEIGGYLPPMDYSPETPDPIPIGFVILYGYMHAEGIYWSAGYAGSRVDSMHWEAADETLREWAKDGLLDPNYAPPKKSAAKKEPILILNGKEVEGAYLTPASNGLKDWNATEGALAVILGFTTQYPNRMVDVSDCYESHGWKLQKYTGRLEARNRVDIRVVRA
jgi:hypothetical protein